MTDHPYLRVGRYNHTHYLSVHLAFHHLQTKSPYEATLYQDHVYSSSIAPLRGPPPKRSLSKKSSRARMTSSKWTPTIPPGSSSHRQEPTTCSGPHAPEQPTHQKPLIWKTTPGYRWWWMLGQLQVPL
jgi:hypothetical protein